MARSWNRRRLATGPPPEPARSSYVGFDEALTAAASPVPSKGRGTIASNQAWQREAWNLYDTLGEFRFAVSWKAEMISRVRLRAGRIIPGQDEPELLESGPAVDLITDLGGGVGAQAQLMESAAIQLEVPGEGFLVGETTGKKRGGADENTWQIRSIDEVQRKGDGFEIIDENSPQQDWRKLGPNSMVTRIWRAHKRFRNLADSTARAAIPTMRELEFVNRHIQAQYLSRLASAGVFIIPDEVEFPVRDEFKDAPDPFVREWIENARQAIKEQGTASAVIPMPMRVPSEYVDSFRHIDFTLKIDDNIIEKRESAIRRLSSQLDVPAEVLLGMGDVNHWTAWQLEESAIKAHIIPTVEVIVHALTVGYLHPRLKALGEDATDIVVWYDASEIAIRPDRSENALQAYDRLELSGTALRREIGFDETDAPTDKELEDQILKVMAKGQPQQVLDRLAGIESPAVSGAPMSPGSPEMPEEPDSDRSVPDTREDAPPPPLKQAATISTDMIRERAVAHHRITFGLDSWTLHHPPVCVENDVVGACPVTEASRYMTAHPGTSGDYECWLSPFGELIVGRMVFDRVNGRFTRGHTRQVRQRRLTNGSSSRDGPRPA